MTVQAVAARPEGLASWAVFSAMLAAAGLPIYIHAPKFYVDEFGVSLAALGVALFGLRLLDVVQDPVLGWLAERGAARRGAMVAAAVALMVLAMAGLFAIAPPIDPLWWFALQLTLLFSAFSFVSIAFYAQGVRRAETLGPGGHLRLAGWREGGALLGVSLAAVAPLALGSVMDAPFAGFAAGFAAVALLAVLLMRGNWGVDRAAPMQITAGLRQVTADPLARRLLWLALVNSTPVAVTSTLFLFFVESRLAAPGSEGPLLLLFFLAAAVSVPGWARLAARTGEKLALLAGMILSVVAFGFVAVLGAGDVAAFAAISAASGAALGADMTLLPAIFARRLATVAPGAGIAFGLWSFVSKLTLAFAAVALLPLLAAAGFQPGGANAAGPLALLTFLYAVVPCVLKLIAIALLIATPVPEI